MSKPHMRLLVCGGRDFGFNPSDREMALAELDAIHAKRQICALIHGGATGADAIGADWAKTRGIEEVAFPVTKEDWKNHGRSAGPMRNGRMIEEGKPDGVVAFPGGLGTSDMIRQSIRAGLPIWQPFLNGGYSS